MHQQNHAVAARCKFHCDRVTEEAIPNPKVEKIVFGGRLLGSLSDIKTKIEALPYYALKLEDEKLTIVRVESRNIHKAPYLFYIIQVTPESMTVIYSLAYDSSPNMRRAEILKNIATIISLVADLYLINEGTFFQYLDSALGNLMGGLSQNYSTLFNRYESLQNEYRELKKINLDTSASNRNLTIEASQLREENKTLKGKASSLEKYSDEYIMTIIEEWLEVHNSTVDISEFCKTYGLIEPRVEQILDKMVSLGYLEVKG